MITGPTPVGVIVNVCGAAEFVNVRTIAARGPPLAAGAPPAFLTIDAIPGPPERVIVIVPVNAALGVIVKTFETALIKPPAGPVSV
jgi:hypothetical protein